MINEQRYWQNRETANIGLVSSVGRAPARQSGGHRFKSHSSKFFLVYPKFNFTSSSPLDNKYRNFWNISRGLYIDFDLEKVACCLYKGRLIRRRMYIEEQNKQKQKPEKHRLSDLKYWMSTHAVRTPSTHHALSINFRWWPLYRSHVVQKAGNQRDYLTPVSIVNTTQSVNQCCLLRLTHITTIDSTCIQLQKTGTQASNTDANKRRLLVEWSGVYNAHGYSTNR